MPYLAIPSHSHLCASSPQGCHVITMHHGIYVCITKFKLKVDDYELEFFLCVINFGS